MAGNDIIKLNYTQARAMAASMKKGAKQLEASINEMNRIMSLLQGGGLRGEAGEAFIDGMRSGLIPNMQRLQQKYVEVQLDILKNVELNIQADRKSRDAMRN